jgi:outer membrane protein assembly factor BamD
MKRSIQRPLVMLALMTSVAIAGCAGSGRLRYSGPQDAYQKGLAFYERNKYERAAEYLQAVFDFGRAHEWAADAQFLLAQAYFHNEEYILSASEFSRFSEIYRTDPRVPEAEYWRAMAYYELSPKYQLDQSDTQRAIDQFLSFIERFPDHERAGDAVDRIQELRQKQARKDVEAAILYERRELFEAAALTYERVFDEYSTTQWADDALLGATRAWLSFAEQSIRARQPERLQRAIDNYQRLVQLFPDSPLVKDAESLYARAADQLAELNGEATSEVHAEARLEQS